MSVRVAVLDYGRGNLHSILKALERLDTSPRLIVEGANDDFDLMIIPGVGAFSEGMRGLRERGLDVLVRRFADSGRGILGICLGCQMLMSSSEEFGSSEGLNLIPGPVVRIPSSSEPVPLMGWKRLAHVRMPLRENAAVFPAVKDGAWAYFVHSYHCQPVDPAHQLARIGHGGNPITAAIGRDNIFGFQFHPEKSGEAGLDMLANFLQLPASKSRVPGAG